MAAPFYADDRVTVHHGDCLDVLRTLPDCSVDSVVTDPPAGVAFMGKDWDTDKGGRDAWVAWLASVLAECRRILKPGAHALVWALPRTSGWTHRAIEDAGLDVRDCITHLFGSGFPKSLDVGKAIDRAVGAEREVVGRKSGRNAYLRTDIRGGNYIGGSAGTFDGSAITAPATEDAARWDGWGTALKPSSEMWYLARRPLAGTVAQNVTTHGTGALNIGGCRVNGSYDPAGRKPQDIRGGRSVGAPAVRLNDQPQECHSAGRWPSNVVLTHGDCTEDVCAADPADWR